jgi:hypothetical protein
VAGGVGRRAAFAQDGTPAMDGTPEAMTALAITITAHEFMFEGPSEIEAGLVTVILDNQGEFRHHAAIFQLNEGVTTEQFVAGLETGEAFGMGTAVGGPGTVRGGNTSQVILRLAAADYVGLCFVTGGDGIPHYAKGMVFPFTVAGEDAGEPDPEAAAEIVLDEYSVQMPTTFSAGKQVWKVSNVGEELHQVLVQQPPEGSTAADYIAVLTAPPAPTATAGPTPTPPATPPAPAPRPTDLGGIMAMAGGRGGWAVLDLAPGEYVAVCFIRDANGVTHAAMGMVTAFTVA